MRTGTVYHSSRVAQLHFAKWIGICQDIRRGTHRYNRVSLSVRAFLGMFSEVPAPPGDIFKTKATDRMINYHRIFQAEEIGDGGGGRSEMNNS